eukprot:NODE_1693_length_1329_cov_1938.896875_g1407_i0.p10 GENE.NODE_1693_length_1329_cov_1938.896875_g1407_i0~~NODE_1693_length_1329_cov_1938.896875_g1407_i0.p10  ORF type:complete len:52 (-),score=8.63 NODE_1693_length_1329_cov_1938.896875_g1407_i0:324-479(-)
MLGGSSGTSTIPNLFFDAGCAFKPTMLQEEAAERRGGVGRCSAFRSNCGGV